MQVEQTNVAEIKPDDRNPNRHGDDSIAAIADSIARLGWRGAPIVVRKGVIVAGHGRYAAALKLGMKTVPTVNADDLSDDEARSLLISDNRTADLSYPDPLQTRAELDKLAEDLRIGWSDLDLDALAAVPDLPAEAAETALDGALGDPDGANPQDDGESPADGDSAGPEQSALIKPERTVRARRAFRRSADLTSACRR